VEEGSLWLVVGLELELAAAGPKGAGVRLGCGGEGRSGEVKGSRLLIGDREVRRGSNPLTRVSPGHQVAGTGPASAGVRAQGETPDGQVDAARRPIDGCGHDTWQERSPRYLGACVLRTTRARMPRLAVPRSPARAWARPASRHRDVAVPRLLIRLALFEKEKVRKVE
jgi:hypothetical protein